MRKPLSIAAVILVLGLCFTPAPARASAIVPGALAGVEGNLNNRYPFHLGSVLSDQRYQQVYAASEFSGATWIDAILFRPDLQFGNAFSSTLPSVQIDLSTTLLGPDALSVTFATNVGADNTTVFNGALSLSSADTGGGAAGPRTFDILITLTTPFFYNPALGNLLLDVRNFGGGSTTVFDAHVATGDSVSRVLTGAGGSVNSLTGETDSLGLVTQFQTREVGAPVPEPATLSLLGLGLVGAAVVRYRRRR